MTATDHEDEFLAAAAGAVRASGADALDELGWWELLDDLDDPDSRAGAFALFRAQGRALASTPALGGLAAQPYLAVTDQAPPGAVAALPRRSARRGLVHVAVGPLGDRPVLLDRPGEGVVLLRPGEVELRPLGGPGRLELLEVAAPPGTGTRLLDDRTATPARARSAHLGRVALALEILGATEAALALAVEHARDRDQFGQPIGSFQAVRHLLAWASTDCVAVEEVARQAVRLDRAAPPRYDEVAKALAGRNGRRACERALQVLGAVGFTAEHEHHHHHGRVLALDALLGTSAALAADLGRWLRADGGAARLPRAVLLPTGPGAAPAG